MAIGLIVAVATYNNPIDEKSQTSQITASAAM